MTTNVLREDMKRTWEKLQALRDEVRLKVHLAGMDARDEWDRIERLMPGLEKQVERTALDVGEVTRSVVASSLDETIGRLTRLRDKVQGRA